MTEGDYGVKTVKPGRTYRGRQGFTYGAGASAETVGARQICMNILPISDGDRATVHYHENIETIAYLLDGQCRVYFGDRLEEHLDVAAGEQIFVPANVPHAPFNQSGTDCRWLVVHGSGSDQDGIVLLPELDELLAARV
jgi:uncharacterized RmlC-like cupin family protein